MASNYPMFLNRNLLSYCHVVLGFQSSVKSCLDLSRSRGDPSHCRRSLISTSVANSRSRYPKPWSIPKVGPKSNNGCAPYSPLVSRCDLRHFKCTILVPEPSEVWSQSPSKITIVSWCSLVVTPSLYGDLWRAHGYMQEPRKLKAELQG